MFMVRFGLLQLRECTAGLRLNGVVSKHHAASTTFLPLSFFRLPLNCTAR